MWIEGDFVRDDDVLRQFGKDGIRLGLVVGIIIRSLGNHVLAILDCLCKRAGNQSCTQGYCVGIVARAEEILGAILFAIAQIKFGGELREVNYWDVFIFSSNVDEGLRIVVGVVACRHTIVRLVRLTVTYSKLVSEVVHAVATNGIAAEILAADRCDDDRLAATSLGFVDKVANKTLEGSVGSCTTIVCRSSHCGIANIIIIGFDGVSVGAFILFVIMSKLDDDIITLFDSGC